MNNRKTTKKKAKSPSRLQVILRVVETVAKAFLTYKQ